MHVLMIAQSVYEFDARILRQTASLVKNNHTVDIICLSNNGPIEKNNIKGINVYPITEKFEQDNIVLYIFNSLLFLIKAVIKSFVLYRKKTPDIIQIHNMPDYLVFSSIFLKIMGVPVVLDIHDLTVELFKEKWGTKKFNLFKPLLLLAEKLSIKYSDRVITVSEQCGKQLQLRGLSKDKLTIVMSVPDLKYFPYFSERKFIKIEKGLQLIYHGTIAERYGLHNTIISIPDVIKKIPDTVFTMIGGFDSEYGDYLRNLVDKLGLNNNIIFEASIPYFKVSDRLKSADIGIITESILEYSNFGIATKVFEYAAVGLPIIVNDLPVNRSVFRSESASFVNHNESDMIASEIINLALDSKRRAEMSKNAFEDLQKISFNVMNSRYLALMNSIIKNKT